MVIIALAATALVARIVYVQGVDASRFAAFGESQRVRRVQLPAARGAIFDRNGAGEITGGEIRELVGQNIRLNRENVFAVIKKQ